jgi:hypothetical protein
MFLFIKTHRPLFRVVHATIERFILALVGAMLFLAASWCLLGFVGELLATPERTADPACSPAAAALYLALSLLLFSAFRVAAGPALLAGFRRILAAGGVSL